MKPNRIVHYLKNPLLFIVRLLIVFPSLIKSDELFLKLRYYINFEKWPDLKNPKTFNEKLQWLKLHDRKPIYTKMVDKCEAKKYVADIIGEKYVIPTLAVYERTEDIDFEALPNQFVLKCTHDSGGIVICKDKSLLDRKSAIMKLQKGLKRNYFYMTREWPYKNVKPRIIAEQYMEDKKNHELSDYKWFCFDGKPKALFIATDRFTDGVETKFDFYDSDFNHLPFTNGHPNATRPIEKPDGFDKMKELACWLSKGMPHVRVDFYDVNGHIYFGELTLFHWSGMVPFNPEKWDLIFGNWIKLRSL